MASIVVGAICSRPQQWNISSKGGDYKMRNTDSLKFIQKKFENLVPSMRYHDDMPFEEWQKRSREKLNELLGLPFKKCDAKLHIDYVEEKEDYQETRFTFQSEEDYFVPCHLLIPKGKSLPVPAIICLQGHSTGMHISLGIPKYPQDENSIKNGDRDFAMQAVRQGYAAVVMEQRYMGECGGDESGPGCASRRSSMASLLLGRCAIGERVWDIQRLIDVLVENFPQVDSDLIMCLGNSGGGTTTFYAACLDERIKAAIPSCSVCTYADSIVALSHCGCNYIPHIAKYFDMGDLGGLIAPRKLIVVAGKEDPIFPIHGVMKTYNLIQNLYNKASCGDNVNLVVGEGGHRFYAEETYKVLKNML